MTAISIHSQYLPIPNQTTSRQTQVPATNATSTSYTPPVNPDSLFLPKMNLANPARLFNFSKPTNANNYTINFNDLNSYPQSTNFTALQAFTQSNLSANGWNSVSRILVTDPTHQAFNKLVNIIYPGSEIISGGDHSLNAVIKTTSGEFLKLKTNMTGGIMLNASSLSVASLTPQEVQSFLNPEQNYQNFYINDFTKYPQGADLHKIKSMIQPGSHSLNINQIAASDQNFQQFIQAVYPQAEIMTVPTTTAKPQPTGIIGGLAWGSGNFTPAVLKMPDGQYYKADILQNMGCTPGLSNHITMTKLSASEAQLLLNSKAK